MLTGAIIGAGLWATLALAGILTTPKDAQISAVQTLIRLSIFTGCFAFWGWVLESVL